MPEYYVVATNVGEAKMANALALGIPLEITELAVGDGEGSGARGTPIPNPEATALVSERRRAPLNSFSVDPNNTNVIIAEQVIPETAGGWWIREMGLFDQDGDMIFVCNTPPTYKPQLSEGSGRTQVVRMASVVSNTASVTLKVDPSVILATRQTVEELLAVQSQEIESQIRKRVLSVANTDELRSTSGTTVHEQANVRDNNGQGWLKVRWDPDSTAADDGVDVFKVNGITQGRWISIGREGGVKVYPSAPVNPPLYQLYVVASPLAVTESGITSSGSIYVTFEISVDPNTVTNIGDGSGSLEFFDEKSGQYITGNLSTSDNTTFLFTPTAMPVRGAIIRVEPEASIISDSGLAYGGESVNVETVQNILWPYLVSDFDQNFSARKGSTLTLISAQTFTFAKPLHVLGLDTVIRSRKDSYPGTGDLKISIVEVVSGEPTGAELATVTLANFTTTNNDYEEFSLDFDAPVDLDGGVAYAIVFEVVNPSGDCVYQMPVNTSNAFSDGHSVVSNSGVNGGAWEAGSGDCCARLGLV
ncbi:phage tail protein [Marinobacter nauticus]|nr:phage tail protein [Marinobacter nauticus]